MSSSGKPLSAAKPAVGAFAPFSYGAFSLLWTATLISNTGTWMHDVGAGWLMTTMNPSPAVVTLVQAATTLPVFCFALLAGALADRMNKRRMLIVINIILAGVVTILAALVWLGAMTPALLILFTLAIGTGAAFAGPAMQAVVPQLVPREALRPAIALNSMGINISRAIGPAVAGVLIASVGLAAPFAVNALSFIVILAALMVWHPDTPPPRRRHGSLGADMATGLRHVRHNAAMLATVIRAAAFFLSASAYWSLLPLIARGAEGGGAQLYGILMALIGAGAVTGALALPRLQRTFDANIVVRIGTGGTVLALLIMAGAQIPVMLMAAAFLGGISWIAVLTSFNVSAQTALPDWVRARGLAVFLMVFSGSMSFGSFLWGQIAQASSIRLALLIAAAGLGVGLLATRRFAIGQGEALDYRPAAAWPQAPVPAEGQQDDQAAMVTVEYRIAEQDRATFVGALTAAGTERMRNGATAWHLHQSVEDPEIWLETFHLPSWTEHLEQHDRVTRSDMDAHTGLRRLHLHPDGPIVRHYIAPGQGAASQTKDTT
ncbi:MFS transporter [Frigidibacter sp.]|uniref:MFS transporter n=1 Tax=Frigidibacter sp. TaxID=2586418 RepID=UPI00273326CD|nr:MFS transporter [Frigidibacter sp.]MDP3340818.1 MFS transporter [Frigidibacter sp.]